MKTKTKWILGITAIVLVVVVVTSTSTDLFQGSFGKKITPGTAPVTTELCRKTCPECPRCPAVEVPRYVNRAELARIIVGGFDLPIGASLEQHFADVLPSSWAFPYVETAYARGIVSGMPDGLYHPEQNVTRAEFAAVMCNALGCPLAPAVTGGTNIPVFIDVPGESWYSSYVRHLYSQGVFAEEFKPADPLTREFAIQSVARANSMTTEEFLIHTGWEL